MSNSKERFAKKQKDKILRECLCVNLNPLKNANKTQEAQNEIIYSRKAVVGTGNSGRNRRRKEK